MREALNRALTWTALILPWGMLVAYLHIFWSYSPQYQYGWLVVPLGLRLFLLRWNAQGAFQRGDGIGASGSAVLFAFLIAPLWFIRQATTHWSIPGYGLTALVIAYTFAVLGIMGGWRLARQMAIPILFIFCAVKLPLTPEEWLIQNLSRFVSGSAVETLHLIGIPSVHSGNLVILNKGVIGINEACSGIHSLQSLFMVAIFLGEERRMRIALRCFMVGLGVVLSLAFNVLRIVILSLVCVFNGLTDFEQWHDNAGWSILLLSLGIMVFLANELGGKVKTDGNGPPPSLRPMPLWMAATATVWFLSIVIGSEAWYRSHDTREADARRVEICWPRSNPSFADVEIPDRVRDVTLCSDGKSGRWSESDGGEWTLSMLQFGGGSKGTTQWAPMHTPDICYPASGMPLERSYSPVKLKLLSGDMVFQCWEFKRRTRSIFVFYCRHSEGRNDASDAFLQDAFGVTRALQGQRNLGEQTVEFALAGYDTYDKALSALQHRLPSLLELLKANEPPSLPLY